ncbi:MAG TPA: hypothetical protein VKR29_05175 [Candidatus Binataceae bacterium]|nr:hypothetical protein [Candidatus Binataceae bacterium]
MTAATKFPPDVTSTSPPKPTSARKAEANRRNAQQSTGPRTEQGKANSRLNALKHGILASNASIAVIEGREHREEFGAMVDGLAADFQPVGTFEQLLVEDIAGCFWRKRRLLRFETRAAFDAHDRRTHKMMQRVYRDDTPQPAYSFNKNKADHDDILDEAHLGFDLPDENDLKCAMRYETTITRTLRLALTELRGRQAERKKNAAANPSQYAERDVVIDREAMKLNAGPGHASLGVKKSLLSRALDREQELEEQEAEDAENPKAAQARDALHQALQEKFERALHEDDETKPNSPANTGTSSRAGHAGAASAAGDRAAAKPQV